MLTAMPFCGEISIRVTTLVLQMMLVALVFCHDHQTHNKAKAYQEGDVILGGLFPVHSYCPDSCNYSCGDLRSRDIVYFTQAMIFAIDEANNNSFILPGISLGFDILDYCSKDVIALEEASNFFPSCSKAPSPPIVGVIGPYSSSVALQVSNLLGLFKVPHISYGATSPVLSDKQRFKYFARTVPSDEMRSRALVDLLLHNGTLYVSVVYSDDEFGREGRKSFTKEATNRGICIGTTEALLQGDQASNFDETVIAISERLNSRVIVLFCSKRDIGLLFRAIKKLGKHSYFRWVIGGDSSEMSVYLDGNDDMASNVVICSPHNEKATIFKKWTNTANLVHRNPWISEILEINTTKYGNFISHEGEQSSTDIYIQSVISSVYTFVHVLDEIYKTDCKNMSNPKSCLQAKSQDGKLVLERILTISFMRKNGRKIEFDKNGDISAEYDFLKPLKDEFGSGWGLTLLGRWSEKNWSGSSMVTLCKDMDILPRTLCSQPCKPGEIKIPTKACCWKCNLCNNNEITTEEQMECLPCNKGFKPDVNKTKCLKQPVVSVDPSSGFILFTVSFSSTGLACALLTLVMFIRWRAHPLIKASSCGLSCLLLVGIMITYGESFLNLITPDNLVCSMRGYTRLGHVMCYAVMFSKTLRVNRLFNSTLRETMNPTFVSTRSHLAIISFIVGFTLTYSTVWGFLRYQQNVSKIYTPDEVVVQCNITRLNVAITNSFYLGLLALCAVYTFKTRKLPKLFRETKGLALAIYLAATIHLIVLSIVCTMGDQNLIRGRAVILSQPLAASAIFFPVYLPKLYSVVFQKEKIVSMSKHDNSLGKGKKRRSRGFSLRLSRSTLKLLQRRNGTVTARHLGVQTDELILSHCESLATLSEDSRSRATSTETLPSNRCLSITEQSRREERCDGPSYNENTAGSSVYSTWL